MKFQFNYFRISSLFLFLIAFDQLSKYSFFENSVCNNNIAWNIRIAPGFFYFIWTAVFLSLFHFFLKSKVDLERFFLVLILSGAFSNLLGRFTHGCVVDFIDLKFWPVFNMADIYITIGIISLIAIHIKHKIPVTKH